MAKKNFDNFLTTVAKPPKLSPDEIEEMTREVHEKTPSSKTADKVAAPNTGNEAAAGQGRRGRKPKPPEEERMIRVSVDLPESVIIDLKARVIREKTDMKSFVRKLVEKELKK